MADFYYSEYAAAQRAIRDAVVIHAQAIVAPLPSRIPVARWSIDNRGIFDGHNTDSHYKNDRKRLMWKAQRREAAK